MIFIIKVTTNKEERAVDMIADRVEKKNLNVFSVSRPHGLRGYILLEAEDRDSAEEAVFNLPYVKGIIGKTIGYEEIKNMVEPSATAVSIKDGDIVEIIAEPFKKEKAKVWELSGQGFETRGQRRTPRSSYSRLHRHRSHHDPGYVTFWGSMP